MNYDFKANWDYVILPLLSNLSIKKSIKKGITKFIKECELNEEYNCKKCPAEYTTNDGWVTYIEDYKETLANKLIETGFLKQSPIIDDDEDPFENPEYLEYENYKETILEPFIKHHKLTSLRAYQIFGACHWWNPTFCLSLAKLIYPHEKWISLSGENHTTVVNKERTLVFDILYFDENDVTKGGQKAIENAIEKPLK